MILFSVYLYHFISHCVRTFGRVPMDQWTNWHLDTFFSGTNQKATIFTFNYSN